MPRRPAADEPPKPAPLAYDFDPATGLPTVTNVGHPWRTMRRQKAKLGRHMTPKRRHSPSPFGDRPNRAR